MKDETESAALVGVSIVLGACAGAFLMWALQHEERERAGASTPPRVAEPPQVPPPPPPSRVEFPRVVRPKPAALIWLGPVNLSQVQGCELAGVPSFNVTCTGDGTPTCGQIAESWTVAEGAAAADAADRFRDGAGRRLPGMRRALRLPEGPLVLAAFSAGGSAVKRLVAHPADREEVAAIVLVDGTYTTEWADKRAGLAAPIPSLVEYAKSAARGERLFVATASASPNKNHPTGAQTLAAIAAAAELPELKDSAGNRKVLPLGYRRPPAITWQKGDAWGFDFASAYTHGGHATELAAEVWPRLVAAYFAGQAPA